MARPRRTAVAQARQHSPQGSSSAAWVALALAAGTILLYASLRHHGFVGFDDSDYVSANPIVSQGLTWSGVWWAFTTSTAGNWHPLTWLSHMLDVQLFGMHAGAHLVVNLALHVFNTVLCFAVLRRMTAALWQSAFVAALFAVHPLHVESVAWIAERKDVLSTLFWMLTMWAYVEYVRDPGRRRYLTVVGVFALGLMAKPMLVTLPIVLLLLDVWPLGQSRKRYPISFWLPLFGLSLASAIVTLIVQSRGGAVQSFADVPLTLRVTNALVSYISYAGKMFWPAHLAAMYPYPREAPLGLAVTSFLALAAVSVLAVRWVSRRPYFFVGWFWYLVTLLPVIGLVQVGPQSMADRYTYVPLVGLFIAVAWGASDLLSGFAWRRVLLGAAATAAIAACASSTRAQIRHWQDGFTLWQHALDVTADNAIAQNNFGQALAARLRTTEAIEHYTEAIRLKPDYWLAHVNLGEALASQGKTAAAIEHFTLALRAAPTDVDALANLGLALVDDGRVNEAVVRFGEALRLNPHHAVAHAGLASALDRQGKADEAIREYEEALRADPNLVDVRINLAALLAEKGRVREALQHLDVALAMQPGQPVALRLKAELIKVGR